MWGVYLDSKCSDLFQGVIQYDSTKAEMIAPIREPINLECVKPLPNPPKFGYNARVSLANHPELTGRIAKIYWHFNRKCFYYIIEVNGKLKSRRYFADDLVEVE